MFLVPPVWSASDTVLVVPLDGSVRVRFQFSDERAVSPAQPVCTMSGAPSRAASAVASSRWFWDSRSAATRVR